MTDSSHCLPICLLPHKLLDALICLHFNANFEHSMRRLKAPALIFTSYLQVYKNRDLPPVIVSQNIIHVGLT